MRRRKPDSMEIQQMKTQAREEKAAKEVCIHQCPSPFGDRGPRAHRVQNTGPSMNFKGDGGGGHIGCRPQGHP